MKIPSQYVFSTTQYFNPYFFRLFWKFVYDVLVLAENKFTTMVNILFQIANFVLLM